MENLNESRPVKRRKKRSPLALPPPAMFPTPAIRIQTPLSPTQSESLLGDLPTPLSETPKLQPPTPKGMGNWKSALHVTPGAPPTRMLKKISIPKYTEFFACGALVVIISIPFNIDKKLQYTPKSSTEISVLWSEIWVYPRNFQYTFETLTEISVSRIFSLPRNLWWTFQYTLDQNDFSKVKCTLRSLIRLFSILRHLWRKFQSTPSIPVSEFSVGTFDRISVYPSFVRGTP